MCVRQAVTVIRRTRKTWRRLRQAVTVALRTAPEMSPSHANTPPGLTQTPRQDSRKVSQFGLKKGLLSVVRVFFERLGWEL